MNTYYILLVFSSICYVTCECTIIYLRYYAVQNKFHSFPQPALITPRKKSLQVRVQLS
jgi:hypothetical protein